VSLATELSQDGRPVLIFKLGPESEVKPVKFEIRLIHYEYLQRIRLGGLPTSYSHQCYEDLLGLKAILLSIWDDIEQENTLNIHLLDVNDDGHFDVSTVELHEGVTV
jgi:hypothetical protein